MEAWPVGGGAKALDRLLGKDLERQPQTFDPLGQLTTREAAFTSTTSM